jgi:hypothetical protein
MMRIVVIFAAIAAFGHDVSSRPQTLPISPSSFLDAGNKNNSFGAPFGFNPASLLKPETISALVPVPWGQAQATAAPAAPTEAGSARKKRSPAGFPFQELIPTGIPSNCFPIGKPEGETASDAKPSGD